MDSIKYKNTRHWLIIGIVYLIITYLAYTVVYMTDTLNYFTALCKLFGFLFYIPLLPIMVILEIIFHTNLFGMTFESSRHNWIADIFLFVFWISVFFLIGYFKDRKNNLKGD